MTGLSIPRVSAGLRSAQQLLDQRLHVPAGLALGDVSADASPDGREVPRARVTATGCKSMPSTFRGQAGEPPPATGPRRGTRRTA